MSKAMVARLREKPGGEDIGVTIGDFATTTVDGSFSLAYLVFNTISNLTTQAAQVACFRNAAAHLEPGGCFVIEVGVPGLRLLPPGETIHAFHVSETRWGFDEYDVANQGMTSHHFEIVDGKVERLSVPFRYAWPAEYDLMAELAGMRLRERWSRMETRAVHEREPHARLGLGEASRVAARYRASASAMRALSASRRTRTPLRSKSSRATRRCSSPSSRSSFASRISPST